VVGPASEPSPDVAKTSHCVPRSTRTMRVSIIVPVLNEASTIASFLAMAKSLGAHELIVADGGSSDATQSIAIASGATLVVSTPGRGPQMNQGAAAATGDVLLFLHSDVRLNPGALQILVKSLEPSSKKGGIFDVYFDGDDWIAGAFNRIYHWRRYFGIFYGDAGIFVRREVFLELGGFKPYPIMEDYEFGRRLFGWGGRMAMLAEPIFVSDRRWRKAGLRRTVYVWFLIQTAYSLGYPAERLGWIYRQIR
jgi:rSAM/selenodomain-associated transferase 2